MFLNHEKELTHVNIRSTAIDKFFVTMRRERTRKTGLVSSPRTPRARNVSLHC